MSAVCTKLAVDNLAITFEDETLNNAAAINTISYKNFGLLFYSLLLLSIMIIAYYYCIQILYYNRVDVSEEIDIDKAM